MVTTQFNGLCQHPSQRIKLRRLLKSTVRNVLVAASTKPTAKINRFTAETSPTAAFTELFEKN